MDNKGLPWKQFCILDGRCSAAARGDWDGTATGRDTNVNTEGRIPKQCQVIHATTTGFQYARPHLGKVGLVALRGLLTLHLC